MQDNELLLFDRIEIIKTTNQKYDLENNAYISFSGGKDSTILHHLIDLALPNNRIPRVFINTGIEFVDVVKFVRELASKDDRFVIISPTQSIKQVLETYGYPFKSKNHSHHLGIYQNVGLSTSIRKYLGLEKGNSIYTCPKMLEYQFTPEFKIKCSDQCCEKLKKEPARKWEKENDRYVVLTGMRKEEGGQRQALKGCIITDKEGKITKFHPLLVVSEEWENWFIDTYKIELCKLYYPPYNFYRTGCKGCPFALNIQDQLDTIEKFLPNEYKQCENIWKPIYEEYRRLNYRLKRSKQLSLFDFINEERS